ncbi:MAG: 30S ribosomal protein S13 [Nanoarchaeota archaeon]|nr:30S ribosomal protein S13 [Nanoarchaeota archaeon]
MAEEKPQQEPPKGKEIPKAKEPIKGKDFKYIVRVLNTDLDGHKAIAQAMLKIKGVGFMYSSMVCSLAGIDRAKRAGNLSEAELKAIDTIVKNPHTAGVPKWMMNRRNDPETGEDKHLFTSDYMLTKDNDIKILKKIKAYRGMRHALGLPVRGQKTKSNFRRNKGKVTGVKRKSPQKTSGK